MRLSLGNRHLAFVGALLVIMAASAAHAQGLGAYRKPENTWKFSAGLGIGMLQTQTQAGVKMEVTGPGIILKFPDFFEDRMAVDPEHLRYWHANWGMAYYKLDGEENNVTMETDLVNVWFGADYFRPGKRLYFSGAMGFYAGHHRNFMGTATLATYRTRDFGGWIGVGSKMSSSKTDKFAWEVQFHTLGGDFMPTLTFQYRF